jgi:hypothetical protein
MIYNIYSPNYREYLITSELSYEQMCCNSKYKGHLNSSNTIFYDYD